MARKKKEAKPAAVPADTVSRDTVSRDTVPAEKPNLKFIGKVPVTKFDIDGVEFMLPADQAKPFYHEQAVLIANRLPNLYQMCADCGCGK